MKLELLQPEPDLEFGNGGRCPDMKFGIGHYGTFDFADPGGPRQVKLGFVGTDETIGSLTEWLRKCRGTIPEKESNQPRLYPPFPGYGPTHSFHSSLIWNDSEFRTITIPQDIARTENFNKKVEQVATLYVQEIDQAIEKSGAKVIFCAPPLEHLGLTTFIPPLKNRSKQGNKEAIENSGDSSNEETQTSRYDFHDLLKARALHLRTPIQIVLPATYDESKNAEQKALINRDQQDEATRAWNLFTALYYKAHGIPWRMTRAESDERTCYMGVSFFRTLDKKRLYASSAQVFNERGDGVIVRGGLAYEDKQDRTIHLDKDGAYNLASLALKAFKDEHGHFPARVVLHKTSFFSDLEHEGFMGFFGEKEIVLVDCLYLSESYTRLFRPAGYPPLRGTLWHLEGKEAILYTRGSVPFYETYPGQYPPLSLFMDCERAQRSVRELARECLELTKMNWNNTRFDGHLPITLRAAKQVGSILKYLEGVDTRKISPTYRFYM